MSTEDRLTKEQRQELKRIYSVASGFEFTCLYPQEVKFLFNLINELAPEPKQPEPIVSWAVVNKNCWASGFYRVDEKEKAEKVCREYNSCVNLSGKPYRVVKLVEQPEE